MTPVESYKDILVKFKLLARPLGMCILDTDYHFTLNTYASIVLVGCYCLFSIYTLAVYDSTMAIQCATCCGVGFQGPLKIYTTIAYSKTICSQLRHSGQLHENIELSECALIQVNGVWFARLYRRVLMTFVFLIMATGMVLALFPAFMFALTGDWYPVLPVYIPFVDETQLRGYAVTIGFHLVCTLLAVIGQILADGMFMTSVLHLWPMCDLIAKSVTDLNELLKENQTEMVRVQYRQFLMLHREYYEYVIGRY